MKTTILSEAFRHRQIGDRWHIPLASSLEVDVYCLWLCICKLYSLSSEQPCYGSLFSPPRPLRVWDRPPCLTSGTDWAAPLRRPHTSSPSRQPGAWLAALSLAFWQTGGWECQRLLLYDCEKYFLDSQHLKPICSSSSVVLVMGFPHCLSPFIGQFSSCVLTPSSMDSSMEHFTPPPMFYFLISGGAENPPPTCTQCIFFLDLALFLLHWLQKSSKTLKIHHPSIFLEIPQWHRSKYQKGIHSGILITFTLSLVLFFAFHLLDSCTIILWIEDLNIKVCPKRRIQTLFS